MSVYHEDVKAFIENMKTKSKELILNEFPTRIIALDALLKSERFATSSYKNVVPSLNFTPQTDTATPIVSTADNPTKKRKHEEIGDGPATSTTPPGPTTSSSQVRSVTIGMNHHVIGLIEELKPIIHDLVETSNVLKMWVTFLIPRIEDGNNFGVEIQEETLGEIRGVEGDSALFYARISAYFLSRGDIIAKITKNPTIEDYRRMVFELDEKEFFSLRLVLREVRNHYASLYDLIMKNWEKIVTPRTNNAHVNLY